MAPRPNCIEDGGDTAAMLAAIGSGGERWNGLGTQAVPPGRTRTICPVTRAAASLTRALTTRAVSCGDATVPVGEAASSAAFTPAVIQPVSVGPGSTALTVTCLSASSAPSD